MTCDDDGQQPLVFSVRFVRKAVGGSSAEGDEGEEFGEEVSPPHRGRGLCPLPRKFLIFFHFKIVHSGAFS